MDTAGTESTAVATNPLAASSSPLPATRNTPPDTSATVNEAEHTSAAANEAEHTQTAGGVSLDSTQATTDPVTSTQPAFTSENSSSKAVIHDVGIDDENRLVDSDMFGFVSIDLRDKDERRPRGFFAKDSKSADDDDVSRGDFGERPMSDAHSTDRAEVLDVREDDVTDPFAAEDPFGNLILGTNPPPVYPLSEWKEGIFINDNNNNNNAESVPMVLLSGQSTPKETQLLTAESEFQNLFPEKQTLQSLDQAACEEGINQQKSASQSSISSGNANKGSGPGPGADSEEAAEGAMVEDGGQTKSLTPLQQLLSLWYVALIFLTPVILLPLPLVINTPEAKCAYVIFVMAVFWVTEVIPIPVTSLMPIFLLPMMGLLTARNTSSAYINDTSILFLGGLTVAIAIETWNLHRRIALAVMMVVGSEPRWLMLGMMAVTWFLSMWISNTATTAMMLPIVQAVLQQISSADSVQPDTDTPQSQQHNVDIAPALNAAEEKSTTDKETSSKVTRLTNRIKRFRTGTRDKPKATEPKCESPKQMSMKKLEKALSLSVAYAANVGGIASLTGTGPNLVLLGQSQIIFEKVGLNTPISFATWLVYGLPLSFILVIVVWLWLQIFFLRCRGGCDCVLKRGSGSTKDDRGSKVRAIIRAEFKKLGPITYAEGTIMVFFAILVVLWITRDLGGAGGWGNLFKSGFVSDSTPAILTAVLMFVLPSTLPDIFFRSRRQAKGVHRPVTALLNWKILHEKMPWSLYLLLGGGFAIARATQESGLSLWLGEKMEVFGALDPWLILLIICYIITFVTEVTSNTAIATIMMPILAQLSLTLNLNPLFFMFPTAITTSFAFMLPVATPPNAIVFAFGAIRVIDMVTCGFVLNVLSVPFLLLATVTWGNAFFHFDVLPPEFLQNVTTLASSPAV